MGKQDGQPLAGKTNRLGPTYRKASGGVLYTTDDDGKVRVWYMSIRYDGVVCARTKEEWGGDA